ncbi:MULTISPECIES: glutathione S-transferase family protein [unclassified Salipiger]|uniref:glutathione S-transferase family protein n=1 Tax=unclassified Salipiger TaxID=2640570 RepID=UPI0013B8635A|nr:MULTISPECIES: glutathione S-transferase N-terminal domain-containing protein [unclassified Salipiger]NDV52342.1 glutathione S-transferase [Salipiger sp. PrR003]NDW30923.1 glutathione S-transferase [Salipiger sp. PrR007]
MLTLYHAPRSRSTRIVQLIRDMSIEEDVDLRIVQIPRQDGSGGRDPDNPHPEGKVPTLVHDGALIRESNAVMLYLTDLYPESPMGRPVGHPSRGAYLSWLAWYGNVFEPVYVLQVAGVSHPITQVTFRDVPEAVARLSEALAEKDWLVDDQISAADLLVASTYGWFHDLVPDDPRIKDWVARCLSRPAVTSVIEEEMAR